jgi:excisionase family DNA binding protein
MSTVVVMTDDQLEELIARVVRETLSRSSPASSVGEFLTTDQAAALAGVQPRTVRTWIRSGLPAKRRGRRLLISRKALDSWCSGESPQATNLLASLTGGLQ